VLPASRILTTPLRKRRFDVISAERFAQGLHALERATGPNGMFGETFFKAVARVLGPGLSPMPVTCP